jgi:UDP-2-acetamido-3-amino-2,3-dideoxy-glucuronate N-acetyltransferase
MTLRQSDRAPNLWVADDVQIPDDAHVGVNVVLYPGVRLAPGCYLEDGAVIGKRSRPGPGSIHHAETEALETVIGERTLVGTYTVVCVGAVVGSDVFLGDHSLVRDRARVGDGVSLGRGSTIGLESVVGDRVRTQGYVGIGTRITIEEDVFLGPQVIILSGLTMRHDEDPTTRDFHSPTLRRGCRLGSGAQVMPGVEIGAGSVVGANAVVVRDVPPGVTVKGTPAR